AVPEPGLALFKAARLLGEAGAPAAPSPVVVGALAAAPALGHRPQQRRDRRHPRPAPDEDQVVFALAEREHAERPADLEAVTDRERGVEEMREQAVRVYLDHELELAALPARRVRPPERSGGGVAPHRALHAL